MSVTSGFFNSVAGDRKYNAEEMSKIFEGLITDGIIAAVGTSLEVTPSSGMILNVGIGRAWFNKTWTDNDAALPLTIAAAEAVLNRIDVIVLEVDTDVAVRANTIKIIKGTPASTPSATAMIHTTTKNQYPLAHVYVAAGATTITVGNITDKRGTVDCPFVVAALGLNVALDQHIADLAAHGATGGVVGVTKTQTLTNKTMTAMRIAALDFIADSAGKALLTIGSFVSNAVNSVKITNSATMIAPQIEATGTDPNINLVVDGKGTGVAIDKYGKKYLKDDGSIILTGPQITNRGVTYVKKVDNLLQFSNYQNSVGVLKIKFPNSWSSQMVLMKIKEFGYNGAEVGNNAWELLLGGFAPPSAWQSVSAVLSGKSKFTKVRFGHDGTSLCILIGDTTTRWDSCYFEIELLSGFTGYDIATTGWVASIEPSEAGITISGTPILQGIGRYTQLIAITGPASGSYVIPPGVSAIGAFLLSGGGGGAGSDTSGAGGGGGAGGNCLVIDRINVTEGQAIAYAVGGGGGGGAIGGSGGQGGTTTFSVSIAGGNGAPGSQSGNPATGTANGGTGASAGAPATAGTSSAGNSPNVGNIFRAAGLNSFTNEFAPAGGGGGATEQFPTGGAGGNGAYGNAGAGGNSGIAGGAGGIGCGGGGGGRSAATRGIGGAGGAGMLVIYELR